MGETPQKNKTVWITNNMLIIITKGDVLLLPTTRGVFKNVQIFLKKLKILSISLGIIELVGSKLKTINEKNYKYWQEGLGLDKKFQIFETKLILLTCF